MLKKILIGVVLVVGGFLAFAATRPDTYHVERSTQIAAPTVMVFEQLEDLRAWAAWSPWDKRDPQMQKTFDGPGKGVGASYSWQGNKQVGKGKMEITETQPPTQIKYRLTFIEPFAGVANTGFTLAPAGEGNVAVTWSMDGTNNFMGKIFGIFMSMDGAIGGDFDKGLAGLKTVVQAKNLELAHAAAVAAQARAVAAAEEAKQAQAAAAAAAQAVANDKATPHKNPGKDQGKDQGKEKDKIKH